MYFVSGVVKNCFGLWNVDWNISNENNIILVKSKIIINNYVILFNWLIIFVLFVNGEK